MSLVLPWLVHVGYFLMLCALLARDVLWLRAVLMIAQANLAVYAAYRMVWDIAAWNAAFVVINGVFVVLILRARRAVMLPAELKPIHERHFAAMTPAEFLQFWALGNRRTVQDGRLIVQGTKPEALLFLLSGEAIVRQVDRKVAHLAPGAFIAEMSLLTGEPTTADVDAHGEVTYMAWPIELLARLRARSPALWTKVQSVLGHDLVEKIKRASAR